MKITIVAVGSRGDIQPSLALAVGLKAAGFTPCLAVPENFKSMVDAFGIDFYPIHGDWETLLQGQAGQALAESGQNPITSMRSMWDLIGPMLHDVAQDMINASADANALVCHAGTTLFGLTAAQYHKIPFLAAVPMPFTPTSEYPSPLFPLVHGLGPRINMATHQAVQRMMWTVIGRAAQKERVKLGLPRQTYSQFYEDLKQWPTLDAYSHHVVPEAKDWPRPVYVTGYWFLDEPQWTPPDDLKAFLDAGDAPVYIGFGSMIGSQPEETTQIVLDALAYTGQRAILVSGWGGLAPKDIPSNLFLLKSAPHNWLFSRVSAVVHHGGAGTTAAGLRAGRPTLIIPHVADQFFWGQRLHSLGVGVKPIPRSQLTAVKLAAALDGLRQPAVRERAVALGWKIRAENGVKTAIDVIRSLLG